MLARDFGKVRLAGDRAEFEVKDSGLCGLRKVARPGGFAHVDVYFEGTTSEALRKLFIGFVEDHVRQHGVEIREHIAVTCSCGKQIDDETVRLRIARGETTVVCPVCETRHALAEGAQATRERDPQVERRTWALKTEIERRRETSTRKAVQALDRGAQAMTTDTPIRVLHLSDLHFHADTSVTTRLHALADDLRYGDGWGRPGIDRLDYLVISGDLTDKGNADGFERAYDFVSLLTKEFGLSAERCIFVPGNHDVRDMPEAFETRESADGQKVKVQSDKYPLRLKPFSDGFYHKYLQRPYPMSYAEQGIAIPFPETGLQFLTFNSCWQLDHFNRKRSGVHLEAVAHALDEARKQEVAARAAGQLTGPTLRIAVWHHAAAGPEQMQNTDFLGHLQKGGVKIALHGDVHELRRELVGYWQTKPLHIVGAGSFAASRDDRPESTPRLYNLLEIGRDLKTARVHTRSQPKPDGPWKGWNEWPRPDGGDGGVPYYDISL